MTKSGPSFNFLTLLSLTHSIRLLALLHKMFIVTMTKPRNEVVERTFIVKLLGVSRNHDTSKFLCLLLNLLHSNSSSIAITDSNKAPVTISWMHYRVFSYVGNVGGNDLHSGQQKTSAKREILPVRIDLEISCILVLCSSVRANLALLVRLRLLRSLESQARLILAYPS